MPLLDDHAATTMTEWNALQESLMAQPHDPSTGAGPTAPANAQSDRLRRYLPDDWALAVVEEMSDPDTPPEELIASFVHLAAARYTIATYLPRRLVHQLLAEHLESPWLRWVEGSLL